MKVPFRDKVEDIPDHVAAMLRDYGIKTLELTYVQAQEQLNMETTRRAVEREYDKIVSAHLKIYG